MRPEIIDNINKPSHYQGANGLEGIEVIDNFIGNLQGRQHGAGAMQSSICFVFRKRMVLKI